MEEKEPVVTEETELSEEEIAQRQFDEVSELLSDGKRRKDNLHKKIEYVDLETLPTEPSDVLKQQQALKSIFSSKPSVLVTCSQSGYTAKVSALYYKDIVTITNSTLSNYDNKKEIYKIMYSKITEYSADKWHPSFDEWLKATSLGDVETLFYGLYCATFQEKSVIRYECPFCGEINTMIVDNKRLVRADDTKGMLELSNKIRTEATTVEKIKEFSSVSDTKENKKSVRLPDSKIIFTISLPSLYKTLETLRTFSDEELAAKSTDAVNVLLATLSVAIPNAESGKYSFIESKKDVYQLLDILSVDDFAVLREVINELLDAKRISYYVENEKCVHCKKKISKIPLDMEQLLFFQISEKQLS